MKLATKILSAVLLTGVVALANTLVTVNGKAITQQAVDTELMNATQGRFNQVPAEKQAEFRQQVLQQLIGKELIYGDAKKTGVLKTKEYKEELAALTEKLRQEANDKESASANKKTEQSTKKDPIEALLNDILF